MSESTTQKTDNGGAASIAALMAALLVAIFAFQLNASMLSPALVDGRPACRASAMRRVV